MIYVDRFTRCPIYDRCYFDAFESLLRLLPENRRNPNERTATRDIDLELFLCCRARLLWLLAHGEKKERTLIS